MSSAARDAVMEVVRAAFRPEFLNRLDEILLFRRLSRDDMKGIVDDPARAAEEAAGRPQDHARHRRRGARLAGRRRLRPGLRRAAAEAGDPARAAEPAGPADPRRPHPRRRDGACQRRRQRAGDRRGGQKQRPPEACSGSVPPGSAYGCTGAMCRLILPDRRRRPGGIRAPRRAGCASVRRD